MSKHPSQDLFNGHQWPPTAARVGVFVCVVGNLPPKNTNKSYRIFKDDILKGSQTKTDQKPSTFIAHEVTSYSNI